jgi:hyperosmotically inducible periplasmic protein
MRPGCSLAEVPIVILILLLTACGATTSRTTDDPTTTTSVKIALLNDAQVGALRLDAKTFQGVVTLSGVVRTPAQEQQAVAVARKVSGVRDVKSALKIQPQ